MVVVQGLALLNPAARAQGGLGQVLAAMTLLLATCSSPATLQMHLAAAEALL
jgi:hypothetical protein